mmetsp:Transcript_12997/g.34580  ORF Transcript_12997/g.34580 Transcript_12997/m.34580 type:complete len:82 (-) Transcript_12997:199-444(-)
MLDLPVSPMIMMIVNATPYEARQIKLLCGLVAKAEGSDMHAPDDDMTPGATPEIMPCESTVAHIIDTVLLPPIILSYEKVS